MGVKQLWHLLQDAGLVTHLRGSDAVDHRQIVQQVENTTIAVDLSMWVMQGREQAALAEHFSAEEAATKVAFERCLQWLRHGVTPVLVVEGTPPEEKRGACTQRCLQRRGQAPAWRGRQGASFTRDCLRIAAVLEALVSGLSWRHIVPCADWAGSLA